MDVISGTQLSADILIGYVEITLKYSFAIFRRNARDETASTSITSFAFQLMYTEEP